MAASNSRIIRHIPKSEKFWPHQQEKPTCQSAPASRIHKPTTQRSLRPLRIRFSLVQNTKDAESAEKSQTWLPGHPHFSFDLFRVFSVFSGPNSDNSSSRTNQQTRACALNEVTNPTFSVFCVLCG